MPGRHVYHRRMTDRPSDEALTQIAATLAEQAGALILDIRARGFAVNRKADRTLVTDADGAAEALILDGLRRIDPGVPVIAEEEAAAGIAPDGGAEFWLVDPLDGTRDFAAGLDDFAVNIGLVRQGRPVLGAVGVPAKSQVFFGRVGHGAFRRDAAGTATIRVRPPPPAGLTLVVSRFHGDAVPRLPAQLTGRPIAEMIRMGSAAKFCWVAEGRADCYPRQGRTMEWDSAAPQAVVEAAGGRVLAQTDERPLRYGKPGWENPGIFCVGR